jgi:hypothetical protein
VTELMLGPVWQQLAKYPLVTLEAELCVLIFLLLLQLFSAGLWNRAAATFRGVAVHRPRAVLITGVVALLAHLCALPVLQKPLPGVHDEFSYLLAADTFASGRLANPTHPLWVFFESFHIEHLPTYASMYPPAQGLVLAFGTLLGSPAVGVWLSTVLFCASLCWMLQAWAPPTWALIGGLLCVARIGIFSYWANEFWGGSVAAIGGCLVWGAFGRLRKRPTRRDAAVLGAGLVLLANSRPYEGFWISLPVLGFLGWWFIARPRVTAWAVAVPLALVLMAGVSWTAYYNWRVFGSPLTLPYSVNRNTYGIAQHFFWQDPRPAPEYHHAVMENFYKAAESEGFIADPTLPNYLRLTWLKLVTAWLFFLGPALTIPLIAFIASLFRKHTSSRLPASGLLALAIGVALLAWSTFPHYYAPGAACLYAAVIHGCRRLYVWRRQHRFNGRALAIACLATCAVLLGFRVSAKPMNVFQANNVIPIPWYEAETSPLTERENVMKKLRATGGKHLVIVRYSASHSPHREFVYNRADIDASDIVWARELPNPKDQLPLLDYFRGRTAWLYRPDESPDLVPYSGQ